MLLLQLHGAATTLSLIESHDDVDSSSFAQEFEPVPSRMSCHTVSERHTITLQLPDQVDISEAWRHGTHHACEITQAAGQDDMLQHRLVA